MRPATQAAVAVPTKAPVGSVKKPVHRLGTVKADRTNSRIAFARRAEGLGVPSQHWMLAKGENSLLQRQKAPKLRLWQLLHA